MKDSLSARRLVENEVVFRRANEKIQRQLEQLKKDARAEGHVELAKGIDLPLHFYCECSDENCRQRIVMKSSDYQRLHQNSSQFLIKPGHNVPEIERTVRSYPEYVVVEKVLAVPVAAKLHATDVNNV